MTRMTRLDGRETNSTTASGPDLDLVGGDPALNFINTLRRHAGEPLETLRVDEDVRAWMAKVGLPVPVAAGPIPVGSLLECARALRALALNALEKRKAARRGDLAELNRYLAQSCSHLVLHRSQDSHVLHREYFADSAEQMLAPVAEAVAALLATEDLALVRHCEGAGCVLWFADRPSGRPRRFCTEETCGVRTRVAMHRARRRKALA